MIASPQFYPSLDPDPQLGPLSPEAYLVWEATQELRYEYEEGLVIAMTGGTLAHNDLAINLLSLLRAPVKARGCRINMADAKVQLREPGPYYYPDLVISCDGRDRNAVAFIQYPTVIVEVLSPSTESRDRGKKFRYYQRSETLKEYVLVDYSSIQVEIFRRTEGQFWVYEAIGSGGIVRLESLDFDCEIAGIYEDVRLEEEESEGSI